MTWTETAIAALKRLWSGGVSSREIGRELGMSVDSVTSKARREGLERRANPVKVTPFEMFGDALSEHGDIDLASLAAGVMPETGRLYFKQMCNELGPQAQ
jgi:hypothetical protein